MGMLTFSAECFKQILMVERQRGGRASENERRVRRCSRWRSRGDRLCSLSQECIVNDEVVVCRHRAVVVEVAIDPAALAFEEAGIDLEVVVVVTTPSRSASPNRV